MANSIIPKSLASDVGIARQSASTVSIGSSIQLNDSVLAHRLIYISLIRYGGGDSVILDRELITSGAYTGAIALQRSLDTSTYWKIAVSQTGELTILSSSTTTDAPNVVICGIL